MPIHVTKTFLPPIAEYMYYLQRAWDKGWITNNGELLQELEAKLKTYLGVKHLFFCSNGTIVLQMALKSLNIKKEVITTPFSYVATTNAILWENATPIFVDINPQDFNINVYKIEAAITENTEAILATHVYGNPCNVLKIKKIAEKYKLKVIYDAAHAFGVNYEGKSLLSYGDIATCSFHATKVFHSVEGGCIIVNDEDLAKKMYLYRQFGHIGDDYFSVGINAKNSEFHAAMGLAVLPHLPHIIAQRKIKTELYHKLLADLPLQFPQNLPETDYNYSYFPVVFPSEKQMLAVREALEKEEIYTRRYFFPSLNTLAHLGENKISCPISEDVSSRVLCLPLYESLLEIDIQTICENLRFNLREISRNKT